MARWTASAKWAAGPALDGKCDMPLTRRLSEGLDVTAKGTMNLPRGGHVILEVSAEIKPAF